MMRNLGLVLMTRRSITSWALLVSLFRILCITKFSIALASGADGVAPRNIRIDGTKFVDGVTGEEVILEGSNVVMKGEPWIPDVNMENNPVTGEPYCTDRWFSNYTCYGWNQHDARHMVDDQGWNFVRLGVVWAGAQPQDSDSLDPDWVVRLHNFLDLANSSKIHVLLDVHQDVVGTATCGEGVPMWFSQLAVPSSIGKPPHPLPGTSHLWPDQDDGLCGFDDEINWGLFAGTPDYNIKNPCCIRFNGGGTSWARLGFTWAAQETMNYLFRKEEGRAKYVRYVRLLAEAVKDKPAAFGIETFNEPPSIDRPDMYETWKEIYEAVQLVVPGMAVSVQDTGQAALGIRQLGLWPSQTKWLRDADFLFYAFHLYTFPKDPETGIKNVAWFRDAWNMPALMTEFSSCDAKVPAAVQGIGWSFWEYSGYCDTPVRDGETEKICPDGGCNFGACITGTNGNSRANWTCSS